MILRIYVNKHIVQMVNRKLCYKYKGEDTGDKFKFKDKNK